MFIYFTMTLLFLVFLFVVGLMLLIKASDSLIPKLKELGVILGVSELTIGMTVTAIGTSIPEIATSLTGTISGAPKIVVGTIYGSNIVNLSLILGLVLLLNVSKYEIKKRDLVVLVISMVLLILVSMNGVVTKIEGLIMVAGFAFYFWVRYLADVFNPLDWFFRKKFAKKQISIKPRATVLLVLQVFFYIFLILIGAKILVGSAVGISDELKISRYLIGVIVVAIGTSLPELAVSITSMKKGAMGISVGNLIGGNITNPLLALGSGALIRDIVFNENLVIDTIFLVAITLFAASVLWRNTEDTRNAGWILLLTYGIFLVMKLIM